MRIKAVTAGLLLAVLFIAGIFISSAVGYWRTVSSKDPAKYTTGIFEGEANPADIRGSYSFSDLEKAFDIPVATLAKAFGFSETENPDKIQVKEFEAVYGLIGDMEIGTDSMRLFVALFKGFPYEPEGDTALPQPAWNLLRKEGASGEETLNAFSHRIISLDGLDLADISAEHDEDSVEKIIKGKTLFSELLDWELSREQINEVLGLSMGAPGISVRDFCIDQGIEFSTVKEPLQELLDSM